MTTRLEARAKARATHAEEAERRNNPLAATVATTGGGKSFFLDELGALHKTDLDMCVNPEMKQILNNSVSYTMYLKNVVV